MTKKQRQEIEQIHWWHTIDFGQGITSAGKISYHLQMRNAMIIPENLIGLSVLDNGCWDGFYSFLCEQRGASRVLAIDSELHWISDVDGNKIMVRDEGFQCAKKIRKSKVEYRTMDVYDIGNLNEKFDIIIAFGLIYHLPSPVLALQKMYEICNKKLLLESYVIKNELPVAYFYDDQELNRDPTVWWGMSISCICKILKRIGFKEVMCSFFNGSDRALFIGEK